MQPTKLRILLSGVSDTSMGEEVVSAVVTDSRIVTQGAVFVAVEGERFDGHDFVKDAFQNGAAAVIVNHPVNSEKERQIVVQDTKDTHIRMAKNYKEQFDLLAVAVTGSAGKTTTKEMVAVIFEDFGKTLKNEGNLNNEVGLPQTVFALDKEVKYAVFEMGMNKLGDISKLSNAVQPKASIITGIGISHIEYLKTRENILKAKLEIVEGMPKDGVLVLNGDDEMLMGIKDTLPVSTVTFAIENTGADVTAADIRIRPKQSEFIIEDRDFGSFSTIIPTVGNHNIMDALSAYTLATRLGFDAGRAAKALIKFRPVGMRQHVVDFRGITVVEDCYNANPDSMSASLQALSSIQADGIRIAVLGDMLELGDLSESEHRKIGLSAAKNGIDVLLCFGENMRYTAEAAKTARITSVEWFDDKRSLSDYLSKTAHAGDAVLFKGSRGMKIEEILEMFYKH